MPGTGTTTLDFGAFTAPVPAKSGGHPQTEAIVKTITGQGGIVAGSLVEAWIRAEPAGSADHSMDEHVVEALKITACNIVAGAGFDIRGECLVGGTYGVWSVNWAWV
jgi:hypothetical protein